MTINEKLQHFYETTISEIQKKTDAELGEHRKMLRVKIDEHKRMMYQNAEAEVHAETEHVAKEIGMALSSEKMAIRRSVSARQNELADKLFEEVKDHLDAFMSTPDYDDFLVKKINAAIEYAGEDNLYIYLSEGDEARLSSLISRTGFPLQVAKEAFLGGIKAAIPDRNILIDESFQSALSELRKDYILMGGTNG